jgi:hypothetical protein
MADSKPPARKGSGRRTTVLAALLAVITVVAVWLSNCIPGFGIGSSGSGDDDASKGTDDAAATDKSDKAEPAKSEADKPEPASPDPASPDPAKPEPPPLGAAGKTLNVKIDPAGCAVGGAAPVECSKVCERTELFEGMDDAVLDVAGASHGSVIEMTDCLKARGIDKVAIRRETP